MQNQQQNENMIRCRKCHKWYDRTTARTAKAEDYGYDRELDWTFSECLLMKLKNSLPMYLESSNLTAPLVQRVPINSTVTA